jgi:pyruvate/2-oxoglutarate dehydrogenase complex dihydrolipoamide acyltransferase (E2) component
VARGIVMPSFGMYTAEGTLAQWLKPSGARVEAGEPVAEIETEKVVTEVTAPEAGILHHVAQPGALLQVESLLGYVLAPGERVPPPEELSLAQAAANSTSAAIPSTPASTPAPTLTGGETFASPNARRVAAELGVDLAGLTGTGPGGRITEKDVRAALEGDTG